MPTAQNSSDNLHSSPLQAIISVQRLSVGADGLLTVHGMWRCRFWHRGIFPISVYRTSLKRRHRLQTPGVEMGKTETETEAHYITCIVSVRIHVLTCPVLSLHGKTGPRFFKNTWTFGTA